MLREAPPSGSHKRVERWMVDIVKTFQSAIKIVTQNKQKWLTLDNIAC